VTKLLSALLLVSCLFGSNAARTATLAVVPPLQGRITDTAHLLSTSEVASLTALLADYERQTRHQIVILTVPTTGGETIESFSRRVTNTWRLGLAGWNDGILVTLATQDHGIRIELGTGMEQYISNATAQAIIDKAMVPAFRMGDFAGGLRAGLLPLMNEARKFQIPDPNPSVEATEAALAGAGQFAAKPCSLVRASVASSILGQVMAVAPAETVHVPGQCEWTPGGKSLFDAGLPNALTLLIDIEQKDSPWAILDKEKLDNPGEVNGTPVAQVGDRAIWVAHPANFGPYLIMQKGNSIVNIEVTAFDPSQKNPVTLEQVKALAREVLTHL